MDIFGGGYAVCVLKLHVLHKYIKEVNTNIILLGNAIPEFNVLSIKLCKEVITFHICITSPRIAACPELKKHRMS